MWFSHKSVLYFGLIFFALIFTYFYFTSISPLESKQQQKPPVSDDISFVLDLIDKYYYKKVDINNLPRTNVGDILNSLDDPYSILIESNSESEDIAISHGTYQGIGIKLHEVDGKPMVITVLPFSAAFEQEILEGDFLTHIESKPIETFSSQDIYKALEIKTGDSVNLTFSRQNNSKTYNLMAKEYLLNTVFYSNYGDGLASVRIILFRPQTELEISKLIEKLVEDEIKYLILDLRGNTGGVSNGADLLLNNLIELGTFYSVQSQGKITEVAEAQGLAKLANVKLAVLIDRGTSSRAEIVASALKENNRAVLIGESSFGKGTIWQAFDLPSGSRIHLTTGQWLTPKGNNIEGIGVTPDILVENPWGRQDLIETAKEALLN